jgi:hypothetical protein
MDKKGADSMHYYCSKEVVCPFYSMQDHIRIYHIEGIYKGNRVHISFTSKDKLRLHRDRFCDNINNYKACPIYKLLAEKYGGDENG